MNPAGGIVDFIESTVPYVEEAVIVDTGSLDGTREILEELKEKYPNLRIFDREFKGYADARNNSVARARTDRVLVLDADERLTKKDFAQLEEDIKTTDADCFDLMLMNVFPEREEHRAYAGIHNPRIFMKYLGFKYRGIVWETVVCPPEVRVCRPDVHIKHFVPEINALLSKKILWSMAVEKKQVSVSRGNFRNAPSQTEGFESWKKFNPRREEYR